MIWFYYPDKQWYPYAIVLLATILERRGFSTKIITDFQDLQPTEEDVLCLSLLSKYLPDQEIAAKTHRQCPLVIGGPCATGESLGYWQTRFERRDITLVRGWAETAIEAAIKSSPPLEVNSQFLACQVPHINLSLVPIDFFDVGYETETMDLWSYLEVSEPYELWRKRAGVVQTARGCPFSCNFCSNSLFGSRFTPLGISFVLDEFESWSRAGATWFIIADASFGSNQKYATDLCHGILDRDLKIHWNCEGTLSGWTPELLRLMNLSGCFDIRFGLESASPTIRKEYGKRISLESIIKGLASAREANVRVSANIIVGAKSETDRTIRDTIDFINQHNINYYNVFYLSSFMGSKVYQEVGCETNTPYHPKERLEEWGQMIREGASAKKQTQGNCLPRNKGLRYRA